MEKFFLFSNIYYVCAYLEQGQNEHGEFSSKSTKDFVFKLKKLHYILKDYKETINIKTTKPTNVQRGVTNFDSQTIFNTIENQNIEYPKYGTPIIFTGWKN